MGDAFVDSKLSVNALFQDIMHPTAKANELIAELLADAMGDAGWPKTRLVPDAKPPPFSEDLGGDDIQNPTVLLREH